MRRCSRAVNVQHLGHNKYVERVALLWIYSQIREWHICSVVSCNHIYWRWYLSVRGKRKVFFARSPCYFLIWKYYSKVQNTRHELIVCDSVYYICLCLCVSVCTYLVWCRLLCDLVDLQKKVQKSFHSKLIGTNIQHLLSFNEQNANCFHSQCKNAKYSLVPASQIEYQGFCHYYLSFIFIYEAMSLIIIIHKVKIPSQVWEFAAFFGLHHC